MYLTAPRSRTIIRKLLIIAVVAAIGGTATGIIAQAAAPPVADSAHWYEHPAVIAAIASGVFVVLAKLIDRWIESRKEKAEDEDEEEKNHRSLTSQLEELSKGQILAFIEKRDELHAHEVEFLRQQIISLDVAKFEYREKHNAAMDELIRTQNALSGAYELMRSSKLEFTPIPMRSYYDILDNGDIARRVAEYQQQLNARHAHIKKSP